jgi:hypothetical protein
MTPNSLLRKTRLIGQRFALGASVVGVVMMALGGAGTAAAQRKITNGSGESIEITAHSDGARRDKYEVKHADSRRVWYAQDGSANAGAGETGRKTSRQDWCRVRYLYGDPVRGGTPECQNSFMYSSHLITALDGTHLELWFSPDSLSYFKIRNQDTGIWYAHDGSTNNGRLRTTKQDWCRQIYYHMSGIIKLPDECKEFAAHAANAIAGLAGEAEQRHELAYVRSLLAEDKKAPQTVSPDIVNKGKEFGEKVGFATGGVLVEELSAHVGKKAISFMDWERSAAPGLKNPLKGVASGSVKGAIATAGIGLGVGVAVDYGVEAIKDAAGLRAKDANAGWIAAEAVATGVATTSISTAIMAVAGASANPVIMGVGFLVGGAVEAGQQIAKASQDTGIRFEAGGLSHPRYNRDLNSISERVFAQKNPPGTFEWVECADENGICKFSGLRSVLYGALDESKSVADQRKNFVEVAAIDKLNCNNATFLRDPAPNLKKKCWVQQLNWERHDRFLVKQNNAATVYLQLGANRHCAIPNLDFMSLYGTDGDIRLVSTLQLKGANEGVCGLPNGFYKGKSTPAVYYLSGPGTDRDGPDGRKVGTRYCTVENMESLKSMGGGQFTTVPDGTDITRNRVNDGACNNGRWKLINNTPLNDIGNGWAITKKDILNGDLEIVRLSDDGRSWVTQPGAASRIGGNSVEPWVMTKAGVVFQWDDTGKKWVHAPGKLATDVGLGWIISNEDAVPWGGKQIYRWDKVKKAWINVIGGALRIGGTYVHPWVVNHEGKAFEWIAKGPNPTEGVWVVHELPAGVKAADVGEGWVLTDKSQVYRYNKDDDKWDLVDDVANRTNIGGNAETPMLSMKDGGGFSFR